MFFFPFFFFNQILLIFKETELCKVKKTGFLGSSDGKEFICNAGDLDSVPGFGRSPGKGNGSPLQYFFLELSMVRGAWKAKAHGVANSWTQLSN